MAKKKAKPENQCQELKIEPSSESKGIVVLFSPRSLDDIVKALAITKACHGGLYMAGQQAMAKIVVAVANDIKIVRL